MAGWWCNNHLEKYELVNGKDYDYPIYEMENNPFMFQTTNQMANEFQWTWKWHPITSLHATIKAVRLWHGEFTEDMAIFDGGNRWNYRKFMEFLINMMFSYGCFHGDRVTHNVICISLKNLGRHLIIALLRESLPHHYPMRMAGRWGISDLPFFGQSARWDSCVPSKYLNNTTCDAEIAPSPITVRLAHQTCQNVSKAMS